MASLQAITSAYRAGRTSRRARPPRTPLLVRAASFAARVLPRAAAVRTALLHIAGFGLVTAAAWLVALPLGLLAAGVSLLVLDYLAGGQ